MLRRISGMDNGKTLNWLTLNLPEWPSSESSFIDIPDPRWRWVTDKAWINCVYSEAYFAVNVVSGEMISVDDFFHARAKQRLKPCGMGLKELMEDLNR